LAGGKSSEWIASAVEALLGMTDAVPDLLLTYLPHLDYDLQRVGPNHPKAVKALRLLETLLRKLVTAAQRSGHEVLVFGDYAIRPTRGEAVLPNLALRQAGLMGVRPIQGMAYPDFWYGRAFAMVDHEVAHVYCRDPTSINQARGLLENLEGVDHVLDRDGQREWGIDHANSGDLVITALPGRWFAYPWWTERREAPDFAGHVDIHNKPGFDPCELFFGWPPGTVSQNTAKIGGSHGLLGEDGKVAWASTVDLGSPADLIALSAAVRDWL
jgi:predicted AlkP superfamily pyrophosphatase or phosphodiesterase